MTDQEQPRSTRNLQIVDEMQDSYLRYAMSVIVARALPDVRDGLKPSQRRILAAMHDLKLGPRTPHRKCAKISGDTTGNYHPHGDAVVYPTMVRLAQPFNMRYPLIDGQGNFGSIDGDPPAAMRYTEARMAAPTTEMLEDIDKETVDFVPNYDETRTEPSVLPAKFPNLLVNGSTGIAVGMATNLPPHNLGEICDALVGLIENPAITVEELMKIVPGPDFPTGGLICGRQGIVDAYTRGRGSITLRARTHVEEMKSGRKRIVVDEIPFNILRSTITERIAAGVKDGRLNEISDIRDESDRKNPIRLVVECKGGVSEEVVLNKLFRHTPLQTNYTVMNIALVGKQPQTMSLKRLMGHYLDHRKEVVTRRTRYLLRKARQRAHVLEGLILAVGDIDAIIELIKSSADPEVARDRLMERRLRLAESATLATLLPEGFARQAMAEDQFLTGVQAKAILAMQLQRLTGLEVEKLAQEYGKLVEEIEGYQAVLRDPALVLDVIREDVYEMKAKYADKRRTEITGAVGEFIMEDLIEDAPMIVTISHEGYTKRVSPDAYRRQGRGGRGKRASDTKEGDFLEDLFVATTHDYLLFFTNRGRVYWLKVYDIPEMARTARGRSIANLLKLQENECYTAVLRVSAFEETFVFFATAKGKVKKTALGAFSRPRPSGIIAIGLDPDDSLINVELTEEEDEIVLGTRHGMAVRFKQSEVRAMGRGAAGVRGVALKRDDRVVDMVVIRPGMSLLTVCENGFGKRTDIAEYRLTKRGAGGVINIRVTERNGVVVALKAVRDEDELMLITAKGIMLRTGVSQMREISRATQGVRIIRPDSGDKLVSVARIAKDENGDENDAEDHGTTGPPASADAHAATQETPPEVEALPDGPEVGGSPDVSEDQPDSSGQQT
ncbi:MAG: DNA gyrase subunit A [Phycisphaerae bacterium]|nr:DNA gyrase subunit A [Phycisphaerae bacterium]